MIEKAKALYKCRLCGEVYENCCTDKITALTILVALIGDLPTETTEYIMRLQDIHLCEDGSLGVADLQGFKNEKE